jgi:ABC-2 type transport system permease protein
MKAFSWLVKREIWQHRLELIYAPIATALLFVALQAIVLTKGLLAGDIGKAYADKDGTGFLWVAPRLPSEFQAGDLMANFVSATFIVIWLVAFVQFAYCVNTLYDEKKDRSILFWKSFPVSDSATVLAKAFVALGILPIVGLVSILFMAMSFAGMGEWVAHFRHFEGWIFLENTKGFWAVAWLAVAFWPGYVLFGFTSVAWFLFVSSIAKSKPVLWAVALVVLPTIVILVLASAFNFNLGDDPFQLVLRLLFGSVFGISFINPVPVSDIWSAAEHYRNMFGDPWFIPSLVFGVLLLFRTIHSRRVHLEAP